MKHFYFLTAFCGILFFNSCKKYQPAPAAFFIKPNIVVLSSDPATQGTSNHKITDLYLYVNGKFQGAYQSGNLLPIVSNGENVTIHVFAGIKNNGIQSLSIPWLLYEKITFDTLVESGKTIERNFTFKYNPNNKFVWLENFDNPVGFSLIKATYPYFTDTMYKIASAGDSFENKSIEMGLIVDKGITAFFESSSYYYLPAGNTNVYLELNYKGNQNFEVGLKHEDGTTLKGALIVKAHEEWNKIYIQLSDAVSRSPVSDKYKIFFKMTTNDNANPHVWLDNIKLIYL